MSLEIVEPQLLCGFGCYLQTKADAEASSRHTQSLLSHCQLAFAWNSVRLDRPTIATRVLPILVSFPAPRAGVMLLVRLDSRVAALIMQRI